MAVLFGGLVELGVVAVIRLRHLPVPQPSYSTRDVGSYYWSDINPDFGVWHSPLATYRHRTECFDVTYRTNSYGARDRERSRQRTGPRAVVLGDSFIEGWGVADGQRITRLLEDSTGAEFLNFGVSGHFGTLQALLLYRALAKRFSPDAVVIAVLPDNDFDDNSFKLGRIFHADRYRPYLAGEYPNYSLFYYRQDALGGGRSTVVLTRTVKDLLRAYTYTYNLLSYMRQLRVYQQAGAGRTPTGAMMTALPRSAYYRFSEEDWRVLKYTLEELAREVAGKPLLIVTLPLARDLQEIPQGAIPPLVARLGLLSAEIGAEYVDLVPAFQADPHAARDYYLRCDGHWNARGHAHAAAAILQSRTVRSLRTLTLDSRRP